MTALIDEQEELMKSAEALVRERAALMRLDSEPYWEREEKLVTVETALDAPLERLGELLNLPAEAVLEDIEIMCVEGFIPLGQLSKHPEVHLT